VRKLYTEALVGRGDITLEEAEAALRDFQGRLEQVFDPAPMPSVRNARSGSDLERPELPDRGRDPLAPPPARPPSRPSCCTGHR
jgi:2-oxoglutarate decarboxylase